MTEKEIVNRLCRTRGWMDAAAADVGRLLDDTSIQSQALTQYGRKPGVTLRFMLGMVGGADAVLEYTSMLLAQDGQVSDDEWDTLVVKHRIPTVEELLTSGGGE